MTFLSRDGQHVVTPWRDDLAALIPHARTMDHQGSRYLVMPNKPAEAKLARNLGIAVPPPILSRYDWAGAKPWAIQKTTAALLTESPRAYVLNTMGTGKTRSVLWAADWLMRQGQAKRVLVVAPLSTLTPVWERELFAILPRRRVRVLYGSRERRRKLLAEDADFYVINHHGLPLLKHDLAARGFDIVVIDELATFRNKSTELWKDANAVINPATGPLPAYAWGLTGSPTPKAPTDAWAQVRLLTPKNIAPTMMSFRDQTMQRITQFKYVARKDANDVVFNAMQPSVRFTLDDVMELPPTSYVDREVKLSREAGEAYKLLFKKMRMLTNAGHSITAANEGILQNKLLQVSVGYIYTDASKVYELDATERKQALDEIIAETDRKVIVFVPFLHALKGVADYLRKHGHDIAEISGETSRAVRDRVFTQFQNPSNPLRIIVAHPQCMAHGLTLTAANVIIWYSPTQSLEIYDQANARIVRPSQTSKTLIAHLAGTPAERAVYARLKGKSKMQGLLLDLFKEQEIEF